MNGTDLRSFSHFQILPKSHTWTFTEILKLNSFEVCLIQCKTVKISQNDQI